MLSLAIFSTSDDGLVKAILNSESKRAKIKVIVTNAPNSPVIETAKRYSIKCACFDHRNYKDRISHEKDIIAFLRKEKINLIIFAHYNRLVTNYFIKKYRNRIINVRLHSISSAQERFDVLNDSAETGAYAIHYLREAHDSGEALMQESITRLQSDTSASFKNRLQEAERAAIKKVIASVV